MQELKRDQVTGATVAERIGLLEEELAAVQADAETMEQRWRQEQGIVEKMVALSARVDQ